MAGAKNPVEGVIGHRIAPPSKALGYFSHRVIVNRVLKF